MSSLVRKCSVKTGELWIPDMPNYAMENHAITNETATAKMSLRRARSPLSGSFSVDYLCKYIATTSTQVEVTSIYSEATEPLDCHSLNQELDEESCGSNSSLSTPQDSPSPRILDMSELEDHDMDSGYVSFPPVDDVCNETNPNTPPRSLLGTISNSIRTGTASV
ncbi:hypothetical protein K7432_004499 [Basidiobolus ranarum]|uniref:Uncharacterized protein n=1 Tax=Basidiobolus ranarum TaxID=34480 RepID=A0ABR2W4K7_9FUNG